MKKEIEYIKKACEITDKIFKECFDNIKNFKTEKEIYNFLVRKTKENKCRLAFKPIVANNNWIIHPNPRKYKLKKGFLIIDFGVKYKGYCSDETRTIFLGKPTKKDIYLYNLVLKVQETAIRNLKSGISCSKFSKKHARIFSKYRNYFIHALGHGVGKKIHQKPSLSIKSEDSFKKGDVITIEPGLYFKNKYGIRIEDTILIKNKAELLTKTPKKLITFEI